MPKPVPTSEHFGGMNFKPCSSPPMETISNPKETSKPNAPPHARKIPVSGGCKNIK